MFGGGEVRRGGERFGLNALCPDVIVKKLKGMGQNSEVSGINGKCYSKLVWPLMPRPVYRWLGTLLYALIVCPKWPTPITINMKIHQMYKR